MIAEGSPALHFFLSTRIYISGNISDTTNATLRIVSPQQKSTSPHGHELYYMFNQRSSYHGHRSV